MSWDMSLVYLWKPVGLLYARAPLGTICMMGTTSTGISHIKTCLLQKFSPQVFSVTDDDSVKIYTTKNPHTIWYCEWYVVYRQCVLERIEGMYKWMLKEVWKWLDVPCMHQLQKYIWLTSLLINIHTMHIIPWILIVAVVIFGRYEAR